MRVVLLVTDLQRGGTPLRLARQARALRDAGVAVSVGCLAARGPVSNELDRDGIETFSCGARAAMDWWALLRLARHLRRIRPDLIHATLTHANLAARLVGRWIGIPVATSTATIEIERRGHRWLERWTARLDRGHIVNSRTLAEHAERAFRIPRERIHVVPPAIGAIPERIDRDEARRRLNLPPNAFVILWSGRFDPVKRVDRLIDCVEIAGPTDRSDDVFLLLAGDGPTFERISMRAERSTARGRIRLLGWRNDLGPAMSAADVFVLPSLTEGMPNALLEALAFGLPAIAADIPALREIADACPGVLLAGDAGSAELAAAVWRLRGDAELRAELSRSAARWARGLDAARCAQALLGVYRSVLRSVE